MSTATSSRRSGPQPLGPSDTHSAMTRPCPAHDLTQRTNPRKPRSARGPRIVEDRHDPRSERPRHQSGANATSAISHSAITYLAISDDIPRNQRRHPSQSVTTSLAISERHLAVSDGTAHNAPDSAYPAVAPLTWCNARMADRLSRWGQVHEGRRGSACASLSASHSAWARAA
ncbi:hypothetical protein B0H10DRAFT_2222853 [Mycena sp. CBHHK59/15]|nr:hypothetical protein B0H10DRAFT_2222853 [Mycena sp. CBHHK59/15]